MTPKPERAPAPAPHQPPPQVGRGTYSPPTGSAHADGGATGVKKALFFGGSTPFLWASTKEMGSNCRAGQRPPPKETAHTQKAKTRPPCLSLCTCAPFSWVEVPPPTARSTPFLCSCAKKRGGAPKKRAFGCRHGSCSVPPASPTDSKPQHPSQLRQADLSPRSTHQAPSPSRAKMSNDNRGSSAHANGGATGVKKALFFGGSTPFLWASTKEMGSKGRAG